jgi:hypothetical protein
MKLTLIYFNLQCNQIATYGGLFYVVYVVLLSVRCDGMSSTFCFLPFLNQETVPLQMENHNLPSTYKIFPSGNTNTYIAFS